MEGPQNAAQVGAVATHACRRRAVAFARTNAAGCGAWASLFVLVAPDCVGWQIWQHIMYLERGSPCHGDNGPITDTGRLYVASMQRLLFLALMSSYQVPVAAAGVSE